MYLRTYVCKNIYNIFKLLQAVKGNIKIIGSDQQLVTDIQRLVANRLQGATCVHESHDQIIVTGSAKTLHVRVFYTSSHKQL